MLDHFQLFFNDNFDASFVIKLEGGIIIDCNNTALDLFGLVDKKDVVGKAWFDVGLASFPEPMYETIKEQIYKEKKWIYIFNIKNIKTKQHIKCKINLSLFEYENDYYGLIRAEDVTDNIENEQELRISNDRFEKLIATIPDNFYV
ncbi:MAG: PAS domain S-box-containing protein, partial [Parvicellaceae bacterium]